MTDRTDRELLELAAKAAGIDAEWQNEDAADYYALNDGLWLKGQRSPDNSAYWNPLRNDGDALRLAVKLNMQVRVDYQMGSTSVSYYEPGSFDYAYGAMEDHGSDSSAATRRAIVRAAASIGEKEQS